MKNQQFYVKTARLAVPIMMQNMITIGVNMADNIMVGSLGENALSAVALANQFINIYQFSCMGLGQGASIMTSRFWGMKNEKALKQTIAITTRICLVLGILFTVITWCFPEIIMKIFISEPAVISQGGKLSSHGAVSGILKCLPECWKCKMAVIQFNRSIFSEYRV